MLFVLSLSILNNKFSLSHCRKLQPGLEGHPLRAWRKRLDKDDPGMEIHEMSNVRLRFIDLLGKQHVTIVVLVGFWLQTFFP